VKRISLDVDGHMSELFMVVHYVTEVLHPLEDELEKKTTGFSILWAQDCRMYGLFPVDC
jgi:hypothetical protein